MIIKWIFKEYETISQFDNDDDRIEDDDKCVYVRKKRKCHSLSVHLKEEEKKKTSKRK